MQNCCFRIPTEKANLSKTSLVYSIFSDDYISTFFHRIESLCLRVNEVNVEK